MTSRLCQVCKSGTLPAETLFDNLIIRTEFGGRILSAASPSLEDVFEQCCDMDASLAERLATFAEAVAGHSPIDLHRVVALPPPKAHALCGPCYG